MIIKGHPKAPPPFSLWIYLASIRETSRWESFNPPIATMVPTRIPYYRQTAIAWQGFKLPLIGSIGRPVFLPTWKPHKLIQCWYFKAVTCTFMGWYLVWFHCALVASSFKLVWCETRWNWGGYSLSMVHVQWHPNGDLVHRLRKWVRNLFGQCFVASPNRWEK